MEQISVEESHLKVGRFFVDFFAITQLMLI